MTHISNIKDKSAANLADELKMVNQFGWVDDYAVTIRRAAEFLVASGKGDLVYFTQWSSGSTVWGTGPDSTVVPYMRLEAV